jgi:hypothetical protein
MTALLNWHDKVDMLLQFVNPPVSMFAIAGLPNQQA